MRCRKTRSFLSAYCREELTGRNKLAVSEHLADCSSCRVQESQVRSLTEAYQEMPSMNVSDNFNAKLLDRVARERFAETRTKAMLPRTTVPIFSWGRVAPALATVASLLIVGFMAFSPSGNTPIQGQQRADVSGDAWLTAQPDANPNLTVSLKPNWSLEIEMARAERIRQFSTSIAPGSGFANSFGSMSNVSSNSSRSLGRIPYSNHYYRVRPIIRLYVAPRVTQPKEGSGVY